MGIDAIPSSTSDLPARLVLGPALRAQSDRRLVRLVREGYESAFEEIVRRYRRPLDRFAASIVGGRSEDVTQDSFRKALEALRGGEAEVELRPWLYRIVRNTALNDLRDRPPAAAELAEELVGGGRSAAAEAEQREEVETLVARLRALPERQRAALVMRELEGMGHEEIAAALGISGGAARQAIARGRAAVRGGLGAFIPLPLLRALASGDPGIETAAGGAGAVASGAVSAERQWERVAWLQVGHSGVQARAVRRCSAAARSRSDWRPWSSRDRSEPGSRSRTAAATIGRSRRRSARTHPAGQAGAKSVRPSPPPWPIRAPEGPRLMTPSMTSAPHRAVETTAAPGAGTTVAGTGVTWSPTIPRSRSRKPMTGAEPMIAADPDRAATAGRPLRTARGPVTAPARTRLPADRDPGEPTARSRATADRPAAVRDPGGATRPRAAADHSAAARDPVAADRPREGVDRPAGARGRQVATDLMT